MPRRAPVVTSPPEARTERQVAADTVLRLALAELLKPGASIRHVCLAAGITEGDLTEARARHAQRPLGEHPRAPAPRTPTAEHLPPSADPEWRPEPRGRGAVMVTVRDGEKRCPRCTLWKPLDQFGRMNGSGRPKSMCRPCMKDYQRERYLDLDRQGALAVGLFVLREVDEKVLRMRCPDCGQRFSSGEVVKLIGELHHQHCPARKPARKCQSAGRTS